MPDKILKVDSNITISKSFEFDAAHQLLDHQGKCAGIHGHRYKLEVTLVADDPFPQCNMIKDSYDIKTIVEECIVDRLDHGGVNGESLNDIMNTRNPTVEFMLIWIRDILIKVLPNLVRLRLWETPNFYGELVVAN